MKQISVLAVVLALGTSLSAQLSLRVSARETGSSTRVWDVLMPVLKVENIAPEASAIVRARVLAITTRLSEDETDVLTDYELLPLRFYKGSIPAQSHPGLAEQLVVTRLGGTVKVDGLTLTTKIDIFPDNEDLRPGEDVIAFLQRSPNRSGYEFAGGPFGVFQIADGTVAGWTKSVRSRRHDQPETLTDFERRLAQAGVK